MTRNDILCNAGMAAMFFGGYWGAQSIWWGWVTAALGAVLMGLVLWLQHRGKTQGKD